VHVSTKVATTIASRAIAFAAVAIAPSSLTERAPSV